MKFLLVQILVAACVCVAVPTGKGEATLGRRFYYTKYEDAEEARALQGDPNTEEATLGRRFYYTKYEDAVEARALQGDPNTEEATLGRRFYYTKYEDAVEARALQGDPNTEEATLGRRFYYTKYEDAVEARALQGDPNTEEATLGRRFYYTKYEDAEEAGALQGDPNTEEEFQRVFEYSLHLQDVVFAELQRTSKVSLMSCRNGFAMSRLIPETMLNCVQMPLNVLQVHAKQNGSDAREGHTRHV
ncbi:hypothetical protein GGX14DRAFT_398630 [Mycena pura]|uniref:Uncharacterized protein n=1 Tax=Mycena pura TaxID=153505 RepID=A0AAD6VAE1_9AGAR|nr:hypothetical protein GGX14DRAFT_398630 [Mycena pura]